MILLLAACFGPSIPPPTPVVLVEVSYPGASASEVETQVVEPLEMALIGLPEVGHLRCEAVDGLARCWAEVGALTDWGTVVAALQPVGPHLPEQASTPTTQRLPPVEPEQQWLVLSAALADWPPLVRVHTRWDRARCDGRPAVAMHVARDPAAPPPAGVSVRNHRLGPERVHLAGPAVPIDAVDAALDGLKRCLAVERGRLEGWVIGSATDVRTRLAAFPGLDILPALAPSRRFVLHDGPPPGLTDLPGVLTVRTVAPRMAPQVELDLDAEAMTRHQADATEITQALRTLGPDPNLAAMERATVNGVPVAELATVRLVQALAVIVRVDAQRATLLDVLLSEDTAEVRAAVDAALAGATPLEGWETRWQRP